MRRSLLLLGLLLLGPVTVLAQPPEEEPQEQAEPSDPTGEEAPAPAPPRRPSAAPT